MDIWGRFGKRACLRRPLKQSFSLSREVFNCKCNCKIPTLTSRSLATDVCVSTRATLVVNDRLTSNNRRRAENFEIKRQLMTNREFLASREKYLRQLWECQRLEQSRRALVGRGAGECLFNECESNTRNPCSLDMGAGGSYAREVWTLGYRTCPECRRR